MLRVGLTGDLGAGKSTVAQMLAERGAVVFSSDEMARAMMQPGEPVYAAIVAKFGSDVVAADGSLDRKKLAALAFDPAHPREAELSAIVHPPVIAAQAAAMAELAEREPDAIAVVESALLLASGNWRERFDRIVVVTAPEQQKIERFVRRAGEDQRSTAAVDAQRRLYLQRAKSYPENCIMILNDRDLAALELQVDAVWQVLLER